MFALIALGVMLTVNTTPVYFVGVAIAGFFLGVLFSVIVTIATRIDHEHISRASSLIATVGGGSDIVTPMITGALVARLGARVSFQYVIIMIIITVAAAIVLRVNITEREDA